MDKTAIKTFAQTARKLLTESVKEKAYGYAENSGASLNETEKNQRDALIKEIKKNGYQKVIEEASFTWFFYSIALRYTEVNGFIEPVENDDEPEETFLSRCEELTDAMPQTFLEIPEWMKLLFPRELFGRTGAMTRLISAIDENDRKDRVEIIGWLYQYYISEKRKETIDTLRGKTVKKEDIPAATQVFTPEWVVRYITDNSLGRYWMERHPESKLQSKLEYYTEGQGGCKRNCEKNIKPQEIKVFDPCVGAGHFLSYAFDLLMEIYRESGWNDGEAARSIAEKNLYGLDIDDRAARLARFCVMMKARKYNVDISELETKLNITSFTESDALIEETIKTVSSGENNVAYALKKLKEAYKNAKEYGSMINAPDVDTQTLKKRISKDEKGNGPIRELMAQTEILSKKYEIVATNPPY
ncbi:MAG: N-6 DNA methylase, partial [Clostridia bacterium]|nr:N-6 DNA methylase [Clostridia bacterium]